MHCVVLIAFKCGIHYKVRQSLCRPVTVPEGSRKSRLPDSRIKPYTKIVRLSTVLTGRLYPPGNIPGTHFYYRLSLPQGHSAAGRNMSLKNSEDTIGNRARDLPACSAVPQPTAPKRAIFIVKIKQVEVWWCTLRLWDMFH